MRIKDLLKSSCQSLMDVLKYAEDAEYQFIWVWQLDQVQLGRFRTITLDLEKLVEARIFTEGKEIHIFDFEGEWKAVEVTTEEDSIYQDEIQILKENNREDMQIISKIESVTGIENLDEIIEVSDGIMVARGDLGVEVPMEMLPIYQQMIIIKYTFGNQTMTLIQIMESKMQKMYII